MPLGLLRGFDSVVQGWAGELGAESRRFPRRIPIDALERAGRSSPPASAGRVVPPAVCYHVYPAWQGRRLTGGPVLVTARGRCFREERIVAPLERLRDFEMREIVALGSREEVESFRHGLVARVSDLVARLELEGRIETASDPFFVQDPAAATAAERAGLKGRGLMQQVLPLKYELQLALDASGHACAVASFNHHLDFFGRRFDIRLASGAPAHSGCVAFGLERWVLAFLSQHGTDPRHWPDAARELRAREEAHARLA
jgi:seryl-tRNA synthetase